MTKKKFVKNLMSHGVQRNTANNLAILLSSSNNFNYENAMDELERGDFHFRVSSDMFNVQKLKEAGIILSNGTMRITLSDELKNICSK